MQQTLRREVNKDKQVLPINEVKNDNYVHMSIHPLSFDKLLF